MLTTIMPSVTNGSRIALARLRAIGRYFDPLCCSRLGIPAGYDRDTVRALVRRRKLTEEQREAADALLDQYMSALGGAG